MSAETRRHGGGLGLLLAFLAGALLAWLFSPRSGAESRRRLLELIGSGRKRAARIPEAVQEARSAAVAAFAQTMKKPPQRS